MPKPNQPNKRQSTGHQPTEVRSLETKRAESPSANLAAMARHIELMYGNMPWTYQSFDKTGKAAARPNHDYVPGGADIRPVLKQLAADNRKGLDIAVVPNRMSSKGRKAEHCRGIRLLFADLDTGGMSLNDVFALFPIKPHMVVRSSAGRFHAYWRVEGVEVPEFKPLMLALAAKFGGDPQVADPSRCMRLAGTWHHKRGERARLVYPEAGVESLPPRIAKADFCARMGVSAERLSDMAVTNNDQGASSEVAESRLSIDDVRRLLAHVKADDRDDWRKVGMALHSAWPTEVGYELWTIWSRRSAKFDEKVQRETWGQFKGGGKVTLGTLIHMARQSAPELPTADEVSFSAALVRECVGVLGFDIKNEEWWHFNGNHWEQLGNQTQALQVVCDVVARWSALHGEEAVRDLNKTAVMTAALRRAMLAKELHIDAALFDSKPDLLGVLNGVVNLRTGEFRAGRPDDWVTLKTAVAYDPDAKCPGFIAFVKRMCQDDKSLFLYVLRVLGLCLTAETKDQKMFLFLGDSGGNGKGVVMNLVQDVMGDYAMTLTAQELMSMSKINVNSAAPALGRLRNRRLMLASELAKGRPLDEQFVKRLTGRDKFTYRGMYSGRYIEFRPVGKPVMLCNDAPKIAYGAKPMWRRLRVVPCDAQLTDSAEDLALPDVLAAESTGVLRLLVKQAGHYLAKGLLHCKRVDDATLKLRNSADTVKAWIEASCRQDVESVYRAKSAHDAYREHSLTVGAKPLSPQAFKAAMEGLGFRREKRCTGMVYVGVRALRLD